jgi:hypothetical protein
MDKIWGFVGKKQKNASKTDKREGIGDVWTFVAVDAQIRMVATFLVPQRDPDHANTFIEDLASRLSHRVQLSSDSPPAYAVVVERGFGSEVDESLIVKAFTSTDLAEQRRYSPPELTIEIRS